MVLFLLHTDPNTEDGRLTQGWVLNPQLPYQPFLSVTPVVPGGGGDKPWILFLKTGDIVGMV